MGVPIETLIWELDEEHGNEDRKKTAKGQRTKRSRLGRLTQGGNQASMVRGEQAIF